MSKPAVVSLDEEVDDEAAEAVDEDAIEGAGVGELSDRSNGIYTKSSYARMLTRASLPCNGSAALKSGSLTGFVSLSTAEGAAA